LYDLPFERRNLFFKEIKPLLMKQAELRKILDDISYVKIIVIGDFCLDAYWFIDESMSEVSVETNQVTRPVRQQRYSLGGAGNVTNNLAAIGIKDIRAFGIIGTDPFAAEMVKIMGANGINSANLLVQEDLWQTHTYSKPYIDDKELNRMDFGNFNKLSEKTADLLILNLINEIPEVDIILINQQVPSGIHTDYFRCRLLEVIQKFPDKLFVADSRNYNDYFNGTIRKMNEVEAARLFGLNKKPDDFVLYSEVVASAKSLYKRYNKPLFITRGTKGSLAVDQAGIHEIPGLLILSRVDTVGAGDSYLAGAASALAAGYDMHAAATIGSFVAGVTVKKLFQTGTATPEEIIALGEDPDYIYSSELAENLFQADYLKNSEIEIVTKWDDKLDIRHAIFDHDGTISTLREGWELIMAPMMIKAVLGDKYFDNNIALYREVELRVNDFIDKTTGIQTLVQMKGLLDLIREFGFVPEEKMSDEFGYKLIYNDELLEMVREREKKLERCELSLEDFTLKNSVPFLKNLYDSGVKLYLASGTDEEDVKREAKVLGYDHFFEGRIYGAVGDISIEAKKIVLDRILDDIRESAYGKVVTFGDGPVEIRETKKRNGITVGVASNELRRFGLNKKKRTRLIKSGADIIIPDFSQSRYLLELLNI
jgi:bifunctional ADP-heptose synthase (sugar kinase/adenylyltransferase)/phosphoglycolate phosphatase-like HAD superfamily hydrolase